MDEWEEILSFWDKKRSFADNKKASGMKPKALLVASRNKIMRINSSLYKIGCLYK